MTSSLAFRGASSSTHQWTHDVFLNCRTVDTRRNFVAHLYDALDRRGIKTFLASDPLDGGIENLSLLLETIEGSRISIVVLSQNYASSFWCLDELVKILECKETKGQLIVPVFYKVDQLNVRHVKGSFGDAFAKNDKISDQRRVKGWKTALTQVGNLSGWHLDDNSNEAQVIDELVRIIALHTDFQVAKHPVKHIVEHPDGIESPAQGPHLSSFPSPVGIESHVQEPHLSSSPSPVGIESLVQEPRLSNSPSPVGIESPVQELHLSSSPSPVGIESLVQEPLLPSLLSGNGEQGSNSSVSSQGVILILIGLVIGLLQLGNLFETCPVNMWIAMAASVMCSLSYAAMTKINGTDWAKYSQIIDIFRILSGTLVLVSLASIHLPDQLWWLFFVIWASLAFIIVAGTWIYSRAEGRGVETTISRPQV